MTIKNYISALIMILSLSAVAEDTDPWKLRLNREGIGVYTRSTPLSPVDELRGECVVEAPVEIIWQVFLDVESYTEWVGRCRESRKFDCSDIFNCHLYYVMDLPWPVTNRDIVLKSSVTIIDADTLVASVTVPEKSPVPLRPGCVRMTRMKGHWTFRRLSPGRTHVTMQSWADPAGHIPAFVVNSVSTSVPYETLRGLRSMVKKEKYIRAAKEFDYGRFFQRKDTVR